MSNPNLFEDLPATLPAELFQSLLTAPNLRIERIVSKGHASERNSWYDQEQHEWVLLMQGAARLQFEDRSLDLRPGDYVNIPAHTPHRVDWTAPDMFTIWLAVHYG